MYIQALGHDAVLLHAKFIRPFVQTNKTDAADARYARESLAAWLRSGRRWIQEGRTPTDAEHRWGAPMGSRGDRMTVIAAEKLQASVGARVVGVDRGQAVVGVGRLVIRRLVAVGPGDPAAPRRSPTR